MKKDVAPLWLIIVMIVLLAVAKARGGLDWPWIWVFSPLWLSVVVFSLLVIIFEKTSNWSLLRQIKNYGYLMLGYELVSPVEKIKFEDVVKDEGFFWNPPRLDECLKGYIPPVPGVYVLNHSDGTSEKITVSPDGEIIREWRKAA